MSAYTALVGLKSFFVSKATGADISNATFCFAKYVILSCYTCPCTHNRLILQIFWSSVLILRSVFAIDSTTRLTTAVLIGCSILTTSKQFFGDPIHCNLDAKHISLKVSSPCGSLVSKPVMTSQWRHCWQKLLRATNGQIGVALSTL